MIFVDASALVSMLTDELEGDALADKLDASPPAITSAVAVYEAVAALVRKRAYSVAEARRIVDEFIALTDLGIVPIGEPEMRVAVEAFENFGKGRHPARLNMGDCFAYACAKTHAAAMLFKGDDFDRTDIPIA